MPKFLVIQTAFIGDVVLATGILEKLHHFFPDAQLDYLVRKGNESLLAGHPFLDEVLVWDKKAGKYRDLFRLLKVIRAKKYDKVINVQRFAATGLLTVLSGAKERIGYDKNPLSNFFDRRIPHIVSTTAAPKHEIERCNDLIAAFTDNVAYKPRLYPAAADHERIMRYRKGNYIVIAPASVWFTKQYPAVKWIPFLKKLPADLRVYIVGAPGDASLADEIISGTGRENMESLCGKLSFLESIALMEHARMNYVNDSAPMHFASAVNAPVTAVFCSTIPAFGFGPLSDQQSIVEIEYPLACRPCGLHGRAACPQGHFKCALDIRDEQLLTSGGFFHTA
ncbi:glycosyltransferase family 9 protein [Flavihumibacter petaseus]|nr:glycosyltransferase family 9 protein [Flavihumibacter petaseus]